MIKFNKVAAQGELTITKIKSIPKTEKTTPVEPENGKLIVGHSETGHHHTVDGASAVLERVNEFKAYLTVSKPTSIDHHRGFDVHESVALQPGMYEITTGREYDPFEELIRKSAD